MEVEKSLLVKGLSFPLPPKKLSYSNYLVNFELFYRNIDNLKIISGDNLDYIKTKIKDLALTSFVVIMQIFHNIFLMKNLKC